MLLPESITEFEKVLIALGGSITPNDDGISVIVYLCDKEIILPTSMLATICATSFEIVQSGKYNDFFNSIGAYASNKKLFDSFNNLVNSGSCLRSDDAEDASDADQDAEDDSDADQDAEDDSEESYEAQDAEDDSDQDEGDVVEKVD